LLFDDLGAAYFDATDSVTASFFFFVSSFFAVTFIGDGF